MLSLDTVKNIVMRSEYGDWDSLVINKRKPETHRLFMMYGEYRVCLHKFYPCNSEDAFYHPHAWPAKFYILEGGYTMDIGFSKDLESEPDVYETIKLSAGSSYSMLSNKTWHKIFPVGYVIPTYTVMVNGPEFAEQHKAVRRTKGKDLLKLTDYSKSMLLFTFKNIIDKTIVE